MSEPKYHHSAIDRLPVVETDTPPAKIRILANQFHKGGGLAWDLAEEWARLTEKALKAAGYTIFPTKTANSLADFVLEFAKDKRLQKTAYEVSGKIIVDKDELQDICNAIAVGDQASAWEKLTSMTKDTGS